MKKYFLAIFALLIFQNLFAFGKKDSSADENQTETAASAEDNNEEKPDEFIKIDLFLDTKGENPKNHFVWKNKSASYKDYFDAVSGASKVHSTKNFRDTVLEDQGKALKAPKGLRNLCLFAVSGPEMLSRDDFKIERDALNDKKITITFTHREISYRIESDENGDILVPENFFIKVPEDRQAEIPENSAENPPENKNSDNSPENPPATPKNEVPGENSEEKNDGFSQDKPSDSVKMIYKGKLKSEFSADGIFTLNGTIKVDYSR